MTTACAPSRPLTERPQDRLEELKKTVSASRLNCFHSCRLKFYFRYVLELMKPTTAALFTGKAVHMALQHWSKARWRGAPIDPALLKSLFMENWKESQLSDPVDWQEEEDNERNKAVKKLASVEISGGRCSRMECQVASLRECGFTWRPGFFHPRWRGESFVGFPTGGLLDQRARGCPRGTRLR